MVIPGIVIAIVTFPGVIVHELAHQIFCYLCGVRVIEVKYFQIDDPCGYVIHEQTEDPGKVFMIAMGPFVINTLLGILVILPASIGFFAFGGIANILDWVTLWAGFSILMHAFPSTGDAKNMVEHILKNTNVGIITKVLVAPFIILVYIGALGSVVWLDALYAAAVAMMLPNLLVGML
ncbi:MAG: DUF3267 domain-containing protein [Clostridiales bacterium]|nr:DUF3267 domain-containing protein [Clostridiales bacterium]